MRNRSKRLLSWLLLVAMLCTLLPTSVFAAEDELMALTLGTKPSDGTVTGEPFDTTVSENHRIPGLVNFNGTLIATADARWNYEYDGGGMDLVVSRSTDGTNWSYTYAGYLGDNGNVWNADSSTLMDPVIITDGTTLYLLADMYPAGYSISSSSTTNTFSETGIGFDSAGNLKLSDDNRATYGYYLKGGLIYDSGTNTAVSGYTVDGWYNLYNNGSYVTNLFFSDSPYELYPTSYICMMSSTNGKDWSDPQLLNVKPEGVTWMVLGPGSGLVTQDGYIAFTAYDGSNIYLIYGKDGTWNRVSTSAATNESSIIELDDGTIRAFVKRGGSNTIAYVDFVKNGNSYTANGLTDTGVTNFSQCMVSSLHYSKLIDGKEAVLVCCPSKPGSGAWNGRFNGKIHAFTLDDNNNMSIVNSYAVNGESEFFAYSNMAEMADGSIALLYEDDCISYSAGSYYGNASHITYKNIPISDIVPGEEITTKVPGTLGFASTMVVDDTQTITLTGDGNATWTSSNEAVITLSLPDTQSASVSGTDSVVATAVGTGTSTVTAVSASGNTYTAEISVRDSSVTTTYVEYVELEIGEQKTYTDTSGNYENSTVTNPESTYATMDLDGEEAVTDSTVSTTKATTLEDGATYILRVFDTNYALSTDVGRGDWGTATLEFQSNSLTANTKHMWTLEASGSGYKLKSNAGYLNLGTGNNTAYTDTTTSEVFTLTYTDTGWTIKNPYGKYINALGGLYSYFSAGGWTGDGTRFDLYKVIQATDAHTDITFTGVAKGQTTAVVGDTTYIITVHGPVTYTINYQENGTTVYTETVTLSSSVESYALPGTVTADGKYYTVNSDTLALDDSVTTYNVPVTEREMVPDDLATSIIGTQKYEASNGTSDLTGSEIKGLTISVGAEFQLDVDALDGATVTWASADTSIATVDTTGKVTGVAAGNTTVTATVTLGNLTKTITIPVHVVPSTVPDGMAETDITYALYYVESITNSTVYYSMYCNYGDTVYSDELEQVYEGYVIYVERPMDSSFGMVWLSDPDEGCALTYMSAANSKDEYFMLHSGDRTLATASPVGSNDSYYYKSQTYNNLTNTQANNGYGLSETELKAMLEEALKLGCDGALSMGRRTSSSGETYNSLSTVMHFHAEKLPTVDKVVTKVNERPYVEGMMASTGDIITFTVTVTPYAYSEDYKDANGNSIYNILTYTDADLTDNLTGATLVGATDRVLDITDALNSQQQTADPQPLTYTVTYTVKESDLETAITNTVDLTYTYSSEYSNGSVDLAANAEAKIVATKFYPQDVVVDFGLPVDIHFSVWNSEYSLALDDDHKPEAKYGTATLRAATGGGWDMTYTPTSLINGPDVITMYGVHTNASTGENEYTAYTFVVYPANNVLYEETFATGLTGWTVKADGTAIANLQDTPTTGKVDADGNSLDTDVYGQDSHYIANNSKFSNGTYYEAAVAKGATTFPAATYTFTGTGFELMSACSANTASLVVGVKGPGVSKLYFVDTSFTGTFTDSAGGTVTDVGTTYQIPVVQLLNSTYGEYTVTVRGRYRAANLPLANEASTLAVEWDMTDAYLMMAEEMGFEGYDEVEVVNFNTEGEKLDGEAQLFASASEGTVLYLDGIRVYQPLENDPDAYATTEKGSEFYAVYDVVKNWDTAAVYVEQVPGTETFEQAQYHVNGPQNEIYLKSGSGMGFQVEPVDATRDVEIQVSAKNIYGEPVLAWAYTANADSYYSRETEPRTQTALYYELRTVEKNGELFVVIKNTGADKSILSLVDIKISNGVIAQTADAKAIAEIASTMSVEPVWVNPFEDVSESRYYYDAVAALNEAGIIKGLTDTTFGPDEKTTRGQVVTMLYRLVGEPEAGTADFSDVKNGKYYSKAVAWAAEAGIVKGYEDGTFRPDNNVSRQELVTFLYRYVQYLGEDVTGTADLGAYADGSSINSYARKPMAWAVDNGIVKGFTDNTVRPLAEASRAELAALLYRILTNMN